MTTKRRIRRLTLSWGEIPCRGPHHRFPDKRCQEFAYYADTELCREHDAQRKCEVGYCERTVYCKNLCQAHYAQVRRHETAVPPLTGLEIAELRQILAERQANARTS